MARKDTATKEEDTARAIALASKLSAVIMRVAARQGLNQSKMAAELGYSRTAFNRILCSQTSARIWRLPTLCAVSRVLGAPLSELIRAAEDDRVDLNRLPMKLLIAGTKPATPERLTLLIRQVLSIYPELEEVLNGENYERLLGISLAEIEAGVPSFYQAYTQGRMSDEEALDSLEKAMKYVQDHGGEGKCLFWIALSKVI